MIDAKLCAWIIVAGRLSLVQMNYQEAFDCFDKSVLRLLVLYMKLVYQLHRDDVQHWKN